MTSLRSSAFHGITILGLLAIAGCGSPPAEEPAETAAPAPATLADVGFFQEVSWSPDGSRLAFSVLEIGPDDTYPYHVERMDADGGNRVRLTEGPADYWTSWSPDGSRIVFAGQDGEGMAIYTMAADGSDRRKVTTAPGRHVQPDWSPDGSEIVFVSDGKLATVAPGGDAPRPLGTQVGEAQNPEWAPDGGRIAYYESYGAGQDTVYVVNRDGSGRAKVAAGVFPTWSPDGTTLLVGRNHGVYSVRSDGGGERPLLTGDAFYAEYSPDGSRIAVLTKEEGMAEIVVMRADGTEPVVLLRRPAPEW